MNALFSRSSAALLGLGAVGILLLGAFARFDTGTVSSPAQPLATPVAEESIESDASFSIEPLMPGHLSAGLSEIIKLVRGHVDESVILAYVNNSSQTYAPTADEILYLTRMGLSQKVLAALLKPKLVIKKEIVAKPIETSPSKVVPAPAPVAVAAEVSPAPPVSNREFFYDALAPFGTWKEIGDHGLCWEPDVQKQDHNWRPYVDQGQWLFTDNGWYWQSTYTWGWAPFHYGGWIRPRGARWAWVPDQVWGPAWVSWRVGSSFTAWAALPPGVGLAEGQGLTFNHQTVSSDYDFGIPASFYTFVAREQFLADNLRSHIITASDQVASFYRHSQVVNHYILAGTKIINHGPKVPALANAGGGDIYPLGIAPGRDIEGGRRKVEETELSSSPPTIHPAPRVAAAIGAGPKTAH